MTALITKTDDATTQILQHTDVDELEFSSLARCNDGTGALVDLFFSDEIPDIRQAKEICRGCPVRIACRQGALARGEPWGVWGGELFVNGHILPVKRPRGRPPKYREQLTA